jgi:hypothetical protein
LVPRHWALFGTPVYELLFGFALGVGFLTVIPFAGFFVVLALEMTAGSLLRAAIIGTVFGVGRSLPLILVAARRLSTEPAYVLAKTRGLVAALNGLPGRAIRWANTVGGLVLLAVGR